MSLRPQNRAQCAAAEVPRTNGLIDDLFRFDSLSIHGDEPTEAPNRFQPYARPPLPPPNRERAMVVIRDHYNKGGVTLRRDLDDTLVLTRVSQYFTNTMDVPPAARALEFTFDAESKGWLRRPPHDDLPLEFLQLFRTFAAAPPAPAPVPPPVPAFSANELRAKIAAASDVVLNIVVGWSPPFTPRLLARTTSGTPQYVQLFTIPGSLGLDLKIYENVRTYLKKLGFQFDRQSSKASEERFYVYVHWQRFVRSNEYGFDFAAEFNAFFEAKADERRRRRAELDAIADEIVNGERNLVDAAAGNAMSQEERDYVEQKVAATEKRAAEEAERAAAAAAARRQAQLEQIAKRLLDAIDDGTVLDDAQVESQFTASEFQQAVLKLQMARIQADSKARKGVQLADPVLIRPFNQMLKVIANGFKTLEEEMKTALEREGEEWPGSIAKAHDLKLVNTVSVEVYKQWGFGYFRLLVSKVASNKKLTFAVYFSTQPFRSKTDYERPLQVYVGDYLQTEHEYRNPLVRDSGTLFIAFNALWKAAGEGVVPGLPTQDDLKRVLLTSDIVSV